MLARQGQVSGDAVLDPVAMDRVGVDGLGIPLQGVAGFAGLDTGTLDQLERRRQAVVVFDQRFERAGGGGEQGDDVGVVVFGQAGECPRYAFGQCAAVAQALAFRLQFRRFARRRVERVELLQLEAQQVDTRRAAGVVGPQPLEPVAEGLPHSERGFRVAAQRVEIAVVIQQFALHRTPAERLVEVLAVDVQQHFAEALELLHRDGVAVDKGPRPAVGIDHAPEQAGILVVQRLLREPGARPQATPTRRTRR